MPSSGSLPNSGGGYNRQARLEYAFAFSLAGSVEKKRLRARTPFVALLFALFLSYIQARNRDELVAVYTAPGRHYHNLTHIEDCLGALAGLNGLSATEREILTEAIWWHDVVYDLTRADNEELSARLAE